MPSWDPDQYLRFERERTLPCRDLIARLGGPDPRRIVDLGCGTGTSTALLRQRWPTAELEGVDSSAEMIAKARAATPEITWTLGDARTWRCPRSPDLLFSNAALQWVPDHSDLFPRLMGALAPGGRLAVQMPANFDSPAHRSIRDVAQDRAWADRWPNDLAQPAVETREFYYDLLADRSRSVELWTTEYVHALPDAAAVLEWIKGTTLRPYLDALPAEPERAAFLGAIGVRIQREYPPRPNGTVLFPFRRLFLLAEAPASGEQSASRTVREGRA
jgi:trans-aconitate 2-methyltransferase